MKIAGILPLKFVPEKSRLDDCLKAMRSICDEIIVLHDHKSAEIPPLNVSEELRITQSSTNLWSDYAQRLTLMARATRLECTHCVFLDDDETLGPTLTRSRALELCGLLTPETNGQIVVRVRTAWNDTHWRTDGIFANQVKTFFVLNPLMLKAPVFTWGPAKRLHHFPHLDLPALYVDDYIIHWGTNSLALRERNVAKYQAADPGKEFAPSYDYLLNEDGMALEPL